MYYATVKHHSVINYWHRLPAKTLRGAKILATKWYGKGYHGHVIHVVKATDKQYYSGEINDLPTWSRVIGPTLGPWRYNG